ncbi:MAG: ABC transporter ATP-binding protein [Gammaproteobacteria bacterium]|nr:ABC transporter ATP-binding protein [Pseudomonadales bacterium]
MEAIVKASGLTKYYGKFKALDGIDLAIPAGAIIGLIGPNGAGKTTTLKALLGLCNFEGQLSVVDRDPRAARHKLMEDVCFIADVGILPKWMKVWQALEYVAGVHPRFDRVKAEAFLATTEIQRHSRIKALSKGMVTQLHLALVMAIDVRLLVLDEPTLGLDIIYRKEFYDRLLNDYYDGDRTVIISTHQVEEIETLLTHLVFIDRGRTVLDLPMTGIADQFVEVLVRSEDLEEAMKLQPIHTRNLLGKKACLFENRPRSELARFGELHTPGVSDLFVAKLRSQKLREGV